MATDRWGSCRCDSRSGKLRAAPSNVALLLRFRELSPAATSRGKRTACRLEADLLQHCKAVYCTLEPPPRSTIAAAYSPDGRYIASTHGDHTVKLICCDTGLLLRTLSGHRRTPWVVRVNPRSSSLLASGSLDNTVRLWNASTAECVTSHDFGRPIASLAFHGLGDMLAVASGHKLWVWEYSAASSAATPVIALRTKRSLRAVQFHPRSANLLLTAEVNEADPHRDPLGNVHTPLAMPVAPAQHPRVLEYLRNESVNSRATTSTPAAPSNTAAADEPTLPSRRRRLPTEGAAQGPVPVRQRSDLSSVAAAAPMDQEDGVFEDGEIHAPTSSRQGSPGPLQPEPEVDSRLLQPYYNRLESIASRNVEAAPSTSGRVSPLPPAHRSPMSQRAPSPAPRAPIRSAATLLTAEAHEVQQLTTAPLVPRAASPVFAGSPFGLLSSINSGFDPMREGRESPTLDVMATANAQVALGAPAGVAEQPCTVRLRLWHYDADARPLPTLENCRPRLVIPYAVLCSEMGAHFSPCGRYLAACVACKSSQEQSSYAGTQLSNSPDGPYAGIGNPNGLVYELRVYSLEQASFGAVLAAVAVRAAHCLTSIQFSPSSRHLLLAYGRRHIALLQSLVADGTAIIPVHTIIEVYRVPDMRLIRSIPSAEDEVNVACWSPIAGDGLAYGTKEGRLRIVRHHNSGGEGSMEDELLQARSSAPVAVVLQS
eukprot:jgi/Chlat1/4542/Chrsp29S04591